MFATSNMSLETVLYLLISGAVVVVSLMLKEAWKHRKNRWKSNSPKPPPHVRSWIPWLGSALALSADPDKFLRAAQEKYGPIFSLKVAGKTMIYATSEATISYIYRKPKEFVFSPIRREMQMSVFGLSPAGDSDYMDNHLFPLNKRLLSPGSIGPLLKTFATFTESDMHNKWQSLGPEGELVNASDIVYNMVFSASSKAFFGQNFPSVGGFDGYLDFDGGFPLLAGGLPKFMCTKALASRSKALDVLEEWYQGILDEEATGKTPLNDPDFPFLEMPATMRQEQFSRRDIAVVILGGAWALLANAPVAAIWCVVKLVEHPDAMARVRSEIAIGLRETEDGKIETLLQTLSIINSDTFGFLSSVIQETLRLTSSSYSIRRVTAETVIPYPVGSPGSLVRKGDMVVCITSMNHSDPTIYSNPNEWVAERFTAEYKKGKSDRGERDVANGFLPFGGGVSMCEGRHFASAELRIALICFLYYFDVEKVTPGPALVDYSRLGLGILPVKGKCMLRLKKRQIG